MITTYKLTLSYKGTCYRGWQFQTDTPETIQAYIQTVIADIVNHQPYKVIGASRTDGGVHASGQILKVELPKDVEPENLKRGMNTKLPDDIRVVDCQYIDSKFNANRDVTSKEYNYYFSFNKSPNAVISEVIYHVPEKLDIELMKLACIEFIGEKDFINFSGINNEEIRTLRTITHCSIEKTSFDPFDSDIYYLKIKASGFLKYMIRFLMSALIEVGAKRLTLEDLRLAFDPNLKISLKKAPPCGLHLMKISY